MELVKKTTQVDLERIKVLEEELTKEGMLNNNRETRMPGPRRGGG
jgi:hypothetical protein